MKQLNQKQAIYIAENNLTRSFTAMQKARLQLNQTLLCMEFSNFHGALEKVVGFPVWTHQFASKEFVDELKSIVNNIGEPDLDDFINMFGKQHQIAILSMG